MNYYYVGAILAFVATTVALLHVAIIIPSSDENIGSRNGTTSSLLLLLRGSGRLIAQESTSTKSSIANHERHTKLPPPPSVLHSFLADEYSNNDDSGPSSELVVQAASTTTLRALLPTTNTPPASTITATAAATATTGVMNNLVILVRFADHANRELPSRADVHRLYNSMSLSTPMFDPTDPIIPTGSVRQFYEVASYDALSVRTVVSDWITLSGPEIYYGKSNDDVKFKEGILEALDILDESGFFADYYTTTQSFDGSSSSSSSSSNRGIDAFGILHSGYDAANDKNDCRTGAAPHERIWSHKGGLAGVWKPKSTPSSSQQQQQQPRKQQQQQKQRRQDGDIAIQQYYTSSALRGTCNADIVRIGVLVHELGHCLGLQDLYDETFHGSGLGSYDAMSSAWGYDGSGTVPPSLSAYSKVYLNWVDVRRIVYDGTYTIESSLTSNVVYKIDVGYPNGEYILLENRQRAGYDALLKGSGGIAIYHIDEKAMDAQNNERGYPNMPSTALPRGTAVPWPQNGKHYMIALLPADGQYDLERGTNMGDATDLWHSESIRKELRSGLLAPHPNTNSYQHGSVTPTGIRIYGFSASGKYMTFKIDGLGPMMSTNSVVDIAATTAIPNDISKPAAKSPDVVAAAAGKKPVTIQTPPTPLPVTVVTTGQQQQQQQQQMMCTKGKDLCLKEILTDNCPQLQSSTNRLAGCATVNIGELCIGSCPPSSSSSGGGTTTSQVLNNCPQLSFDVYIRIDCNMMVDSNAIPPVSVGVDSSPSTAAAAAAGINKSTLLTP
jgi:M6 family metalloprotease-like protein